VHDTLDLGRRGYAIAAPARAGTVN